MKRIYLFLISIAPLLCASHAGATDPVRTFHPAITRLCDTTVVFPSVDVANSSMALEVRASVKKPSAKGGTGGNGFAVTWTCGDTTMEAWLIPSADDFDPLASRQSVDFILLSKDSDGPQSIIGQKHISTGIANGRGFNTLGVEIDALGTVTVYAGDKEPFDIFTVPASGNRCKSVGVTSRGEIEIDLLVTESVPDATALLRTAHTPESLEEYFMSAHLLAPEGIWNFLDRDTDERALRLGGDYTIAIVADSMLTHGAPLAYSIIYLSGARVDGNTWMPGMKKGRLTATLFQNHYNLKWIAADMTEIDVECSAQLSDDRAILTLSFPLYGSTVRFARQLSDGALPEK